jgi:glucose-6-phosphate isomerase
MTEVPNDLEFIASTLSGASVETMLRRISDMQGVYADKLALDDADPNEIVYKVDSCAPAKPGTEGGLLFGITHLMPGRIGAEYFMTKGHFHAKRDRAEFYWGIAGNGMLVLMDAEGNARTEDVRPGSLHYVPGHTAHRLVNTGGDVLDVAACWPSDAGHDYGIIAESGFSLRVLMGALGPEIVAQ